ncbi:OB-fold protein [Aquitalea aquatica]|uniref:Uncharacterized protein n=1 Tax=Aquitalea aquatica TaxID=3044273 RepID=A0A838Y8Z6_9NEIS|nr:hypothetical protein [Aquitalea magnusonii]MBA4707505.1 hypothetical protein [Aquitalea magnusonii]
MVFISLLIAGSCFLSIFVALVKPSIYKKKDGTHLSRTRAASYSFIGFFVFTIIGGALNNKNEPAKIDQEIKAENASSVVVIKTSHSDISHRFTENATEASLFYKGKRIQVTDTVNSIQAAGAMVMVNDAMDPYIVSTWGKSVDRAATIKAGDKVTVQCSYVDAAMMSQCDIVE